MNTTYDFLAEINDSVERFVSNLTQTDAKALGLDPRSGYDLYVTADTIVVDKSNDSKLQYYGGFEYVDNTYRNEVGNYVFYVVGEDNDDRVAECLNFFYEIQKEELDEDIVE